MERRRRRGAPPWRRASSAPVACATLQEDDALGDELATLLEDLGRGHELVALLSGRLEDASPDRRAALAPHARTVFERIGGRRPTQGAAPRSGTLYRDALEALLAK